MLKTLFMMLFAMILAAGCRTGGGKTTDPVPGKRVRNEENKKIPASVVHVNREFSYVLLENHAKHKAGQFLTVYRGQRVVARIQVTAPAQGRLITADVITGAVEKGDVAFFGD